MKDFEETLIKYAKDNPSFKEEWLKLEALEESDEFPENLIESSKYESDAIKARSNSILKEALIENDQRRKLKRKRRNIAAVAAAAVIMFFSLTESGRGMARSAYEAIVTLLGGEMHIEMVITEGAYPTNTNFTYMRYADLDEARESLGYPIIGLCDDSYVKVDYIEAYNEGEFIRVDLFYITNEGKEFYISNVIYEDNNIVSNTVADMTGGEYFELPLSNGKTMYCATDAESARYGIATWGNFQLSISSEDIGWDELKGFIDKMSTK